MRRLALVFALFVTVSGTLLAQITVTTTSLPFGTLGANYSAQLMASGGSGEYNWSITQGSLPPNFNLDSISGIIAGTATMAGTFAFTVQAQDSSNLTVTATKRLSIGIPQISTVSPLPAGNTCSTYSVPLAVSDGPPPPYFWSVSDGLLPPGLGLDPNTGIISGKPTAAGNFFFTILASNSAASTSALKNFNLVITDLCFFTTSLPDGDLNSLYRQSLIVIGGNPPYTFAVGRGTLPTGVSLDPKSGVLSGMPTATGTYNFTIQVTDSVACCSTTTQNFTVTINPALAFSTTSPLPGGTAGTEYSQTFAATGGTPPYSFSSTNLPKGLTLSTAGVLSGMPAAGTFNLSVTVTDSVNVMASMNFQLVIASPGALLQVSPGSLTFTATFGGDVPPPQFIDVVPLGVQPSAFQVTMDGGSSGAAAPAWLSLLPLNATAPARLVVRVNQGNLALQSYNGRINVTDAFGTVMSVQVTLNVVSVAAQLQVLPGTLHFAAREGAPGTLEQVVAVRNTGGGGALAFTTTVEGASSWISGVMPASGQTVPNSTVLVSVQVDTRGLAVGKYRDVIHFASAGGTADVIVSLFVAGNGGILGLSSTGVRFQARQGGGFSNPQTVQVLNLGDPAAIINWKADFVTGSQLFATDVTSGTATVSSPGKMTFTPTASALQGSPGGYYALVRISATGALNSPLYVVLVLDLASSASPPLPDPAPPGLFFLAKAGAQSPAAQPVKVNTSSAAAVPFTAAALTTDGGAWLVPTPASGTATGQSPGQVSVAVISSMLAAGIYTGEVDISMSGALRSVNVTLVVERAPTVASSAPAAAASCVPSKLALTETGVVNNFSVPAGWPAALVVQLNDDCGNPVPGGSVTATFSNTDPALVLVGDPSGTYSGTWQPGVTASPMTVTLQAQAGALQPATQALIGDVNQNQNAPPVLAQNGSVNVFNRVAAGALAPGMIVEVYGSGLASTKGLTGMLPLPVLFQGTSLIVGSYELPLYFVSGGQLDAQIAAELTSNQQYAIVASLNGAYSLPDTVDISPVQLGVAAGADGHVIAQHGVDSSYVTEAHPAKPGEVLVIYLSGMGPTNPAVKSGAPAPTSPPFAEVTIKPTVTVDGQSGGVQFAGLTPGFVGLYQINFQVPANAKNGDLTLVVTQNGVPSNSTKLPVAK